MEDVVLPHESRHAHPSDGEICSHIHAKQDLAALCEVTDFETGGFQRCTFAYFDDQDFAWFGQAPGIRKYDLTVEDIKARLEKVPDEKIYPIATTDITVFPHVPGPEMFVKRPQALHLDDDEATKLLPQILIEEAEILELLSQHPHPNIARYYGCTVKRGRATGLVLQRYHAVLQYRYEDNECEFDVSACIAAIRAGVRHLHSLGLAHNDLNPMNIALDPHDHPIILDFGSCKQFGMKLKSAGTPGWVDEGDETDDISDAKHDEFALR